MDPKKPIVRARVEATTAADVARFAASLAAAFPSCPHCGNPATVIVPNADGSRRGVCEPCQSEWWIRSTDAPDIAKLIVGGHAK